MAAIPTARSLDAPTLPGITARYACIGTSPVLIAIRRPTLSIVSFLQLDAHPPTQRY